MHDADLVAVDIDPWLVALGRRQNYSFRIRWSESDLREPTWRDQIGGRFEAVLSSTALHWFDPQVIRRIYGDVAGLLVPRGLFAIADLIPAGDGTSSLSRAGVESLFRWSAHQTRAKGEDWVSFWNAARREPSFASLLENRDRRLGPRPPRRFLAAAWNRAALVDAGFDEIEEIWRHHAAAVIVARLKSP
jgi:hypothetical protein